MKGSKRKAYLLSFSCMCWRYAARRTSSRRRTELLVKYWRPRSSRMTPVFSNFFLYRLRALSMLSFSFTLMTIMSKLGVRSLETERKSRELAGNMQVGVAVGEDFINKQ